VNITLDHNCGKSFVVTWKSPLGVPRNLTGCTAVWQIRLEPGAPLLGEFTVTLLEPLADGRIRGAIAPAVVNPIPDGTYRHDLIVTDAAGTPRPIVRGAVKKQGSISEPS